MSDELKLCFAGIVAFTILFTAIIVSGFQYRIAEVAMEKAAVEAGLVQEVAGDGRIIWVKSCGE